MSIFRPSFPAVWEDPGDAELLRKFLHYPATSYWQSNETTATKRYPLREVAQDLLHRRGEKKIPEDVILAEEVPIEDTPLKDGRNR